MNWDDIFKQIMVKTISLIVIMSPNKVAVAFDLVPYEQNTQPTIPSNYFSPFQNSYFPIRSAEAEIKNIFKPAKKGGENQVNRKLLETYSGTNWNLDTSTGKLTISGSISVSGMSCGGYGCSARAPWEAYCDYIKYVVIENSVTNIYYWDFIGCSNLISITVDSNNPNYKSINGVLFNKAGTTLVSYPNGKSGSYTIPSSVTSLGSYAFCSCSGLTSVTIPNSVTSIGLWAFAYCKGLTSVTIGSGVTSIGCEAFEFCPSLTSINVNASNSNYKYTDGILYSKDGKTLIKCLESKIGAVTISSNVASIERSAFSWCTGLTSVTIPNSVTSIGLWAFKKCSRLTSVTYLGKNDPGASSSDVFTSCNIYCLLVPSDYTSSTFCGKSVTKGSCPAPTPTRSFSPTPSRSPLPTLKPTPLQTPFPTPTPSPKPITVHFKPRRFNNLIRIFV